MVPSGHLSGLSEGTHTSNPPSQPEDSTAWDSFQVSSGSNIRRIKSTNQTADSFCLFLLQSSDSIDTDIPAAPSLLLSPDPPTLSQPTLSGSTSGSSALDELDLLGKSLLQQSLPPEGLQVKWYLLFCPHPRVRGCQGRSLLHGRVADGSTFGSVWRCWRGTARYPC